MIHHRASASQWPTIQVPTVLRKLVACILILASSIFTGGALTAQTSILDAPATAKPKGPGIYSTAEALLSDARKGVFIELLRHDDFETKRNLGKSVFTILQREYGLKKDRIHGSEGQNSLGFILGALTNYNFETDKKRCEDIAKDNENQAFGTPGDPYNPTFEDSRAIFRKFAGQYTQAVKDSIRLRQQQEEQRQIDHAEQKRRSEMNDKQAAEEQRNRKEIVDARQASQKAEDDIKTRAMADALAKAKQTRERKLAETIASPVYKVWEAALVVEQGEKMISDAQRVLDHDEEVRRASGVTDLAARRAAGEQMVAGRDMVKMAFDEYKKVGGKAVTPREVVAGPDPAAEYR